MRTRTLVLLAAVLSACGALAAGVIGGAFAHDGPGHARDHDPGHGPGPGHFAPFDPDTFAVVRHVRAAIAAKAPDIAKPILDQAVAGGDISQAQADRLAAVVADKPISRADAEALFSDPKAAPVAFDIKAAIARQAPDLAKPIVDKAVADDKLTRAQGDRLIAASAWRAEGFGLGIGGPPPGHRGFGPPHP